MTRIKGLRVSSRTSSFAFKGKSEDIRSIGRKLGVATVLEGSVRKAGNQLRISAQLINVEDGCHLWSESYDRELKDVFVIQDEIARSIAATLKIALTPRESIALSKAPTTDLEAYDYYLRGKQFFYQYKTRGVEFALKMYTRAIELDPTYVRAYAGIADCCSFLFMHAGSHDPHREEADRMSRKALELDPESAEAHASRGVACSLKKNFVEAEAEFEQAIRLDPTLFEAYYFYARICFEQGKLEKTIQLYEKSIEVNPQDYQAPLLVAQIYSDLGDEEKAEASRRRGVQAVEGRLKLHPDDSRALYMGANGLVGLGEFEQGLEWAKQALEIDPEEPMVLYNVACIQSLAHRYEDALDSLEKSVACGLMHKNWLEHDSNLDPLRRFPRYKKLIKQTFVKSPSTNPSQNPHSGLGPLPVLIIKRAGAPKPGGDWERTAKTKRGIYEKESGCSEFRGCIRHDGRFCIRRCKHAHQRSIRFLHGGSAVSRRRISLRHESRQLCHGLFCQRLGAKGRGQQTSHDNAPEPIKTQPRTSWFLTNMGRNSSCPPSPSTGTRPLSKLLNLERELRSQAEQAPAIITVAQK